MDMSRKVHFAPPPGVRQAPVVPARFRKLARGDAIRGISECGMRESGLEM
jgi:hypothetical protein